MVFDPLRDKSIGVSVGGCLKKKFSYTRRRKREKVRVGSKLSE